MLLIRNLPFLELKEAFSLRKKSYLTLIKIVPQASVPRWSQISVEAHNKLKFLPSSKCTLADSFPYLIFLSRHMVPEGGTMGKLTHLFSHNCTILKCPSPFLKMIKSSAALTFLIYRGRAGTADRGVDQNMKIRLQSCWRTDGINKRVWSWGTSGKISCGGYGTAGGKVALRCLRQPWSSSLTPAKIARVNKSCSKITLPRNSRSTGPWKPRLQGRL